ncbi:hypothetical protein KIN20_008599 [Parelaphostrongylus tenuis]|uniref:Uncharacterized protein n=1 Tax=Parelaphostrongylus tenuis TaxID=148309 RepID=A0AAD5M6Z9_PARTN|nr:hypothetical protein KIN20_008599 [Parelaphostrongylus tenuis]
MKGRRNDATFAYEASSSDTVTPSLGGAKIETNTSPIRSPKQEPSSFTPISSSSLSTQSQPVQMACGLLDFNRVFPPQSQSLPQLLRTHRYKCKKADRSDADANGDGGAFVHYSSCVCRPANVVCLHDHHCDR